MKNILMSQEEAFKKQLESFGPNTMIVGALLVVLGLIGIILPAVLSIFTLSFIASILIVGGVLWAYHTYKENPGSFADWLKPVLLILTGALLLFFPIQGVASLAIFITFYLLIDSYSSFSLAHSRYPDSGWGWMTFNGVVDIALAGLFLYGWPQTSLLLVGLFVGISLLFDGWALVVIGWVMKKSTKDDKR